MPEQSTTRPRAALPVSAEQEAELAQARRRLRRNGILIVGLLDALIVGVGLAGASDLRSMRTPQGTAAAWADAAAAGDCDRYLDLETAGRRDHELAGVTAAAAADTPTHRPVSPRTQLCREVSAGWAGFSTTSAAVASRIGSHAEVRLTTADGVARADGTLAPPLTGTLRMLRVAGRWRVESAAAPCPDVALSPAAALCHATR